MYAHYIPPPKPKAREVPPPGPSAPAALLLGPPAAPASSAVPYARYVPPAQSNAKQPALSQEPASAQKIVFNYDEEAEAPPKKRKLDSDEPPPDRKKSKKTKKTKGPSAPLPDEESPGKTNGAQHKERGPVEESNAPEEDHGSGQGVQDRFDETGETGAVRGDTTDPTDAEPKKTRVKPKKKKEKDPEPSEDEAEVNSRHKSVLARKEKALQQWSELAQAEQIPRLAAEQNVTGYKAKASKSTESEDRLPEGSASKDAVAEEPSPDEPHELHGLEPLPQPAPIAVDGSRVAYETAPPWLSDPIRVLPSTRARFEDLGTRPELRLSPEIAKLLEARGYTEAFAVQTAVIPRLLPTADRQGDLVISAATGSGKTLAYVLPMVRDISQGLVTRLQGLIVVPTRDLVRQVYEVCDACANVFASTGRRCIKIGVAVGSQAFNQEQAALMEIEQRYDPDGYREHLRKQRELDWDLDPESDGDAQRSAPLRPLPDHVVDHVSKVDILICTPGRLVEHLNMTRGFTLDFVRWLVVDEADKLLAQSYQQWIDTVVGKLSAPARPGARDFPDSNKSGVRKVILSATISRNPELLNDLQGLRLSRPQFILLEGAGKQADGETDEKIAEHVLPELLKESAIKVHDAALKPLYLIELLNSEHMTPAAPLVDGHKPLKTVDTSDDDTSSASSSSESDSSESDSSESDSESASDSDSDTSSDASDHLTKTPSGSSKKSPSKPASSFKATVLVFTKSNETTLRLSRLLVLLAPHLQPLVGTLNSTTRTSERHRTLRAFASGRLRILVASDLVSRGIDLPNLDHVVNYDMPTSVASYVHRVGRTARAGKGGQAWTLFTKTEAGWFWPEIAGVVPAKKKAKVGGSGASSAVVKRPGKVETVSLERFSEERVAAYEDALARLGKEAGEKRK